MHNLVSIIVPTYNSEKFLPETIASVEAQTYTNWELLIIDDGSTDSTLEFAYEQAKKDSRIQVIALENHSGRAAVPRNQGIKIARGELIAFLDSDDLWLPQKLEKQIKFLENNPEIFLIYSKYFVRENGSFTNILPKTLHSGLIFNSLFLSWNFIPCLTVLFRNKKLGGQYFFEEMPALKAVEDFDLWLRIALKEKIGYIEEPLAVYRVHTDNTSAGALPFLRRNLLIAKRYRHLVPKICLLRKYSILFAHFFRLFFVQKSKEMFKNDIAIKAKLL